MKDQVFDVELQMEQDSRGAVVFVVQFYTPAKVGRSVTQVILPVNVALNLASKIAERARLLFAAPLRCKKAIPCPEIEGGDMLTMDDRREMRKHLTRVDEHCQGTLQKGSTEERLKRCLDYLDELD